jgi:hypothetical protein
MRDKLLKRLINLPTETDVVVRLGLTGVDFFKIVEGPTAALLLRRGDLRDTLQELRQRPPTGWRSLSPCTPSSAAASS